MSFLSSTNENENTSNILKNIKLQNINRLVIGHLNINSIRGKFDQLKDVIKNNIDILVITETKLDDSFPRNQFLIDGYSVPYRKDFDKFCGGVMIFVRDDLACKEIDIIELNGEGIFLELNLRKTKWLLFGGYNHKKQNIRKFLSEFNVKLEPLLSKFENFVILGDFNSEIREEYLQDFCNIYNLKNLILEPTCYKSHTNPSSIDVILTNKSRSFQNSQAIETGLSDFHKMTITVLRLFVKKQAPIYIKYRDYKNYDSILFQNELSVKLREVELNDICYDTFEHIFMDVLNKNAKVKKKYIRANNAPFMTKQLSKAIMNRSRLKNRFLKCPNEENEIKYKKQRNYVVGLVKKEKKKYFSNLNLGKITDNKKFWKTVKPFFSEKSAMNKKIVLVEDNNITSDDKEVAVIMNTYFSNVIPLLDIQGYKCSYTYNADIDEIQNYVNKFRTHPSIIKIKENINVTETFFFSIPSIPEIEIDLNNLNKNKPTTDNNIPAKILTEHTELCAPILTKIYGDSVVAGNFPSALKKADIIPGHKKGDTTLKDNYRPVSILPTVSKIYERNMYKDIDNYMQKYLSPKLCGFRKGYSTQYALIDMIEKWKKALDKSYNVAAVLTDLSKAFDCINHELIIAKLEAYGFSKSALRYINSYLKDRLQRTKVNDTFSEWSCIISGVPQGSILGPLLFNIYINDLFYFLDENKITNYADDNTPYEIDKHLSDVIIQLENNIIILSKWFTDNYFKMNADKCQLIVPKNNKEVIVNIDDKVITNEKSVKLLGIKIDKNLDFEDHVTSLCKKASQKLHALARVAPFIETIKLRILMKAFIESQFSYCPLVWMFHSRNLNNRINRLHERALRISYRDTISSFEELLLIDNSFTIHEKNLQRLATEMYKVKNNLTPPFMKNVFPVSKCNINLRHKPAFETTNVKSVYNGTETISFRGPQIWSIIPENIRNSRTLLEFHSKIKEWKPKGCMCRLCKTYIQHIGFIN